MGLGDFSGAIKDATTLVEQAPDWAEPYVTRAAAYLAIGDFESAVRDSTTALRMNSELRLAYLVRGRALQAQGYADQARSDYSQASLVQRIAAAKTTGRP